jgi:simple sugar transport system ATP-binding protein
MGLELQNIEKHFGSVHALRAAAFSLGRGEFHALLGENGAGKSTLMHVAFGLVRPDSGLILLDARPIVFRSARDARGAGLGMVHQHFSSVPALTVAENIALTAAWPVRRGELRRRVLALMERIGLQLDPDEPAANLSVEQKQYLEILKALAGDARILLLDEPTAVLPPTQVQQLLAVIRRFTNGGGSAVLITHKLDEVLAWADRVTVMRHGRVTFTGPVAGQDRRSLTSHMIGVRESAPPRRTARVPGDILVECIGVSSAASTPGSSGLRNATLCIREREIVGIAAVQGNGERELLRCMAGILGHSSGTLRMRGRVAFIPEDRSTEGLIPALSLLANLVLGVRGPTSWVRGRWLDWQLARRRTEELIREFGIVAAGPEVTAGTLSGGNQQKLVIARALEGRPRILVAENPTRGLDIKATDEVHERLREAADGGMAVVVHSSDLDELIELADRLVVVASGESREVPAGGGRDLAGAWMLGVAR